MNCRIKIIAAVFLTLSIASIKSDHIEDDCREIQCPKPEFECPPDSDLKSEDEDEDDDTNPFDRLEAEGLIEEFFPSGLLHSTALPPHIVQKRSLQHRRREAIKIVPGDYRSFEPEFFKYHNHHQPHRKWKRDLVMGVQPHSEAEIKKCCPEFQCVCKSCPSVSKCDKGMVAIVAEQAHGLPGSCCSIYNCVPEMQCNATSQPKMAYWRNECKECSCIDGQELCQQLCDNEEDDSANNCFSEYLNRPILNGHTWLEDQDCTECKCVDGVSDCEESYCEPVDCENPIKFEGRCCMVCPPTTSTSSTTTPAPTTTKTTTTTEVPETTSNTTSTKAPETIPTTTNEASESTTTTGTPSTAAPVTTTDAPISTPASTSTTPTSVKPTTSGPEEIITDEEVTDDGTTYFPPTVIISTPKEMNNLLQQIDVIVVLALASLLVVICTFGTIYMVMQGQKKKKSMYSTIPSSESSQSSSVTLA